MISGNYQTLICFILALYLLSVSAADLFMIFGVWLNAPCVFNKLGLVTPVDTTSLADLKASLLTMLGSSLGACLLSFLGLFQYSVLTSDFNARFIGSYIIGPIAVIFLGFSSFVLTRASLFIFGNVSDISKITSNNELSFLGLGILVGFSWNRVLSRFAKIAEHVFGDVDGSDSVELQVKQHDQPRSKSKVGGENL